MLSTPKNEAIAERLDGNVRGYTQSQTRELFAGEFIGPEGDYHLGQYIFRSKLRDPYGNSEWNIDVQTYQKKIKRRNGTYDSAFSKFLIDNGYKVLSSTELEL